MAMCLCGRFPMYLDRYHVRFLPSVCDPMNWLLLLPLVPADSTRDASTCMHSRPSPRLSSTTSVRLSRGCTSRYGSTLTGGPTRGWHFLIFTLVPGTHSISWHCDFEEGRLALVIRHTDAPFLACFKHVSL